ncbi:hypothetical protein Tco_0456347 [Tanacetum coccineum]
MGTDYPRLGDLGQIPEGKAFHSIIKYSMPIELRCHDLIIFKIPWILSFTYKKEEAEGTPPPLLLRQFSVKWWKQVDEGQANIKVVTKYYNSFIKKSPCPSTSKSSTTTDAEPIKRIRACTSEEELQKILNEVRRSPPPSEDIFQDSQDPYDNEFLDF